MRKILSIIALGGILYGVYKGYQKMKNTQKPVKLQS
jgi:uncharacterized membrane protein YebE (DUF533 family)